jgi:phage shock protein PspC (stress-responsive transcriptional regulator)
MHVSTTDGMVGAFTLGVMFAGGGIFVYLLLWIFVPED